MTLDATKVYELHDLVTAALLKEAQGEPQGIDPRMIDAARRFLTQNGVKINISGQTLATLSSPTQAEAQATQAAAKEWRQEVMLHPLKFD